MSTRKQQFEFPTTKLVAGRKRLRRREANSPPSNTDTLPTKAPAPHDSIGHRPAGGADSGASDQTDVRVEQQPGENSGDTAGGSGETVGRLPADDPMDQFQQAFDAALREHHAQTRGERAASRDTVEARPGETHTAGAPKPPAEVHLAAEPLRLEELQRALERTRVIRQASVRRKNRVSFDEDEASLKKVYGLENSAFRSIVDPAVTRAEAPPRLGVARITQRKHRPTRVSIRQQRISQRIWGVLEELKDWGMLFDADDPLSDMVHFTNVFIARDLRRVVIQWTWAEDAAPSDLRVRSADVTAALCKYVSRVRYQLGKQLDLKYTPDIVFQEDKSDARETEVERIIADLEMEDAEVHKRRRRSRRR